jgi:hypothetical protein
MAAAGSWPWQVELVASPDRDLIASESIVATADSGVLDRCGRWFNLACEVVQSSVPGAWIIDLSDSDDRGPVPAAARDG